MSLAKPLSEIEETPAGCAVLAPNPKCTSEQQSGHSSSGASSSATFKPWRDAVTARQAHPVNSGEQLAQWLGFIEQNQLPVSVAIASRDFQQALHQFFNGPRIRLPHLRHLVCPRPSVAPRHARFNSSANSQYYAFGQDIQGARMPGPARFVGDYEHLSGQHFPSNKPTGGEFHAL